jgi:O-antigen ligase
VFVIVSIPFEGVINFRFISRFLERVTGIRYDTIYYLEDITIYPLEAILAVSILICIYKSILGRDNCFRNTKLVYCYIPFVLCIMLSAIKSIELSLTVKEIVRWLELIVIYYLTINLINDDKKMRVVLYSMFLTMAMVSVIGIININYSGVGYRVASFFDNPNPMAGYANLIIPVSFGMLMTSVCLWKRITLGIFTVLSIIIWILTLSRSAWCSLILTMILLFSLTKMKKRVFLLLVVCLAISAITILLPPSNTNIKGGLIETTTLNAVKKALEPRALCYPIGLNMVKDDLILGIGIGNYPLLIKKYTKVYELTYSQVYDLTRHHLHNLYLQLFVETGFMGLSAFVFWLVCIVKYLVSSLKSLENSRHYWLFVGLMGGVIVYLFNNLADVLTVHGIHLQWGIILGLAVVLIQSRESETCLKTV